MPFFSVIIPLYNKEKFVENTLQSVLDQTFTNYEIIIVNDCSTDSGVEKIAPYLTDSIRLIEHSKNKGLSASRNTGISNSKAKYVTFLDADDLWKPDYLTEIKSLIDKYPSAKLFATNYEEIYPENLILSPKNELIKLDNNQLIEDYFKISLGQPLYCACSLCVDKSVFDSVGFYDEKITYSEDIDFNIRANLKFSLAYSKKALVSYIIFSENQLTNSSLKNKSIPNFDKYEEAAKQNNSLKRYLDFNRYILAKRYKIEKDKANFKKLFQKISLENINWKQRLLLQIPTPVLILTIKIKQSLVKKGLKITTYSRIE